MSRSLGTLEGNTHRSRDTDVDIFAGGLGSGPMVQLTQFRDGEGKAVQLDRGQAAELMATLTEWLSE